MGPWIRQTHSKTTARAATLCAALALCASALAVPPPNDDCAAAVPLTPGTPVTGTAVGATPSGASTCAGPAGADVYYTFTTTLEGVHTLALCTGTPWDTVLSLHSGCPATSASQVACDDDGCGGPGFGLPSKLVAWLPAGRTNLVRVAGFDASTAVGPLSISLTAPAVPTGACCTGETCSITTAAACAAGSGTYLGHLTACTTALNQPAAYGEAAGIRTIPDNAPAGLAATLTVPDAYMVADVHVSAWLRHGFLGDLTLRLRHGAASATLFARVGPAPLGSPAALSGPYTFGDDAGQTMWAYTRPGPQPATIPPGALLASDATGNVVSLRGAFAGLDAQGPWTLEVIDASPGWVGTLDAWSLTLDRGAFSPCTPGVGACCRTAPGGGSLCQPMPVMDCAAGGGSFQGAGVACVVGPANPVACCKANFNRASGVDVLDIFAFLNAWFTGNAAADFNGANGVDILDVFAFLNAWFLGCS